MPRSPEQMLVGHIALRTRNPQELHAHIAGMEGPHERTVDSGAAFDVELRQISLGRIDIALVHSNAGMTVRSEGLLSDSYLVQFPIEGTVRCEIDGQTCTAGPGGGLVISPRQKVRRTGDRGWTLVLRLMGTHLRARITSQRRRIPRERLRFEPVLRPDAGALRDLAMLVVEAVDLGIAPAGSRVARLLEDGFVDLLLELQPHTAHAHLAQSSSGVRARRVRAVEAFVDAHLGEAFNVEILAGAAGCSVRALQETFREIGGTTPMEFARRRRLGAARALLEAADSRARIADIAARTGFQHFSRFAANYRERFGESPSETLRRSSGSTPTP